VIIGLVICRGLLFLSADLPQLTAMLAIRAYIRKQLIMPVFPIVCDFPVKIAQNLREK
jgi:hypothetical protein